MSTTDEIEIGKAIVADMIKGFGPGFPSIEQLLSTEVTSEDIIMLKSPIPHLGRYYKSNAFLEEVTSSASIGLKRFTVIIEYYIALSELLETYIGKRPKIIRKLTPEEKEWLRTQGKTLKEVIMAERIESFSEHDTAAAGDLMKLLIAFYREDLAAYIEGVQYMETSEDTMSIVFGLIANDLIYRRFIVRLVDFCLSRIEFVKKYNLIIPALTHEQAAEPIDLIKKFLPRLQAIKNSMDDLVGKNGEFKPFSAKLNGAVGFYTTFYAAYPEIDWPRFSKEFIEGKFGLYCEEITDQCASYQREANIFSTTCIMLTQVIKMTTDFVSSARCPAQLFVKKKKAGTKASSIMPNKSNAWGMEGAVRAIRKTRTLLEFVGRELQEYPDEGNMGRSILFRDLGSDFMPAFTGLDRIQKEMDSYVPNPENVAEFLDRYPGMSGSSLQIVLKQYRIMGDAYRVIQDIAINPDGSYAKSTQFKSGLEEKMKQLGLPEEVCDELRSLLNPDNLIKRGRHLAAVRLTELESAFKAHRERALKVKTI